MEKISHVALKASKVEHQLPPWTSWVRESVNYELHLKS